MKLWTMTRILTFALMGLSGGLAGNRPVLAQARPETILPPEIERSLVEDSAPNFFQQGMARFEREIERLSEKKQTASEPPILQVRPETPYQDGGGGGMMRDLESPEKQRLNRSDF